MKPSRNQGPGNALRTPRIIYFNPSNHLWVAVIITPLHIWRAGMKTGHTLRRSSHCWWWSESSELGLLTLEFFTAAPDSSPPTWNSQELPIMGPNLKWKKEKCGWFAAMRHTQYDSESSLHPVVRALCFPRGLPQPEPKEEARRPTYWLEELKWWSLP